MFTLESTELALFNGVSADRVPDTLKSRFTLHLSGYKLIDGRLQVDLSSRSVGFFYYDVDKENDSSIKDHSHVREVGSISLTRPKDTGNDILAFPQNISDLDLFRKGDETKTALLNEVKECNETWSNRFWGFPFVDRRSESQKGSLDDFNSFLRYCLLVFVFEFENREMAFGESPIYDEVRDKLRMSDVYNLLTSKLHYTLYLYDKNHLSQNQEQYTFHAQKFADKLMSKKLNKVISPDNYFSSGIQRGSKQGWFYNPEKELEEILNLNRNHSKDVSLKDSLVSKIRSFLYTKHSINKAMTENTSKVWFWLSQGLMFVFNIVLILALLNYEKGWDFLFNNLILLGGTVFLLVFGCFFIAGYSNGKNVLNAFSPRIIVAEAAAWLTIGIAEDLVKSMLWVRAVPIVVAIVLAVLILVSILIYSETKQHSPYCSFGKNSLKTFLVMNHSIYFALVLGCVMQLVFYDNLLKTSNVLSDVFYKDHFDKTEDYLQRLEDLETSFDDYRAYAREYALGKIQLEGVNSGKTGFYGNFVLLGGGTPIDSVMLSAESMIRYQTKAKSSYKDTLFAYHDALALRVRSFAVSIKQAEDTLKLQSKNDLIDYGVFGSRINRLASDAIVLSEDTASMDSLINSNVMTINGIMPLLSEEIRETKDHMMKDGYDDLIGWATKNNSAEDGNSNSSSRYIQCLTDMDKAEKCCISVSPRFWGPRRFYPTLLLLHLLIVLVLAFFTQLIISDKSVTEPL